MKKLLFITLYMLFTLTINAQLLTWEPFYLTREDSVEIIFDATLGNGGLAGHTGDVYAHTGVLTEYSSGTGDWFYVKTGWGENTPETKLESLGNDKWKLVISPSIAEYYGVGPDTMITHLAFVFRSGQQVGGSWLEGKTADGGDIFITMRLGVQIQQPVENYYFGQLNVPFDVEAVGSENTVTMELYINDVLTHSVAATSLEYEITPTDYTKNWVKIVANDNTGPFSADSFYYLVNAPVTTQSIPAGNEYGVNYLDDTSVLLSFQAPNKDYVYVIGDFNNWEVDPEEYMKLDPDGETWWTEVTGLTPAEEYAFQYFVDGELRIADPYSEKVLDPREDKYIDDNTYPDLKAYPTGKTDEIVGVFQTAEPEYNWQVTNFERPAKTDLVIYELLLRDFLEEHDYSTLIDTLDYLDNLGINAIELMPVNEFEGNLSWGYNPIFYFSPDKYYGPKNDFKAFIDECHSRGIAVIMDMVLNHSFGQSPMVRLYASGTYGPPTSENPWFNVNATHDYNVGYDFDHESQYTKDFVDRVNKYWIEEYKIDGYRYDLSKGFTQTYSVGNVGLWGQYDASRIAILKRMADAVWSVDPYHYMILEHFAENSEEKELANYGMMPWGNMNHEYLEAAMGYGSNLSGASYQSRGWNGPHLVAYMESHDEERMMYKNLQWGNGSGNYRITDMGTALNRVKLAAAFFFTIPGPKMIWQFGELGYDYSINWPSGNEDDRLTPKPIRWDYFQENTRYYVYRVFQELIKLKRNYDAFRTTDFSLDVGGTMKVIKLHSSSMNVVVVGNFGVTAGNVTPNFHQAGTWYDYFSGQSINVSNPSDPLSLDAGEFHIYTSLQLPTPEDGLILDMDDEEIVTDYSLAQNYPNPFNPSTTISFAMQKPGNVTIRVYNLLGQEIRTLIDSEITAGKHQVSWDGLNNTGIKAASGIYLYRMDADGQTFSRKMLLLK